ncbi:hypothetical protein M3Y98_01208900 [Aphelenchoides besseyi]|nr:hypothetical protein M3Y98_01208900 [Aphelenchoides besseyi]
MDCVLMFNAVSPILYNVLPSAYMAYSVSKCDNYQWMGFMDTILINLSFILYPFPRFSSYDLSE